MGKDSLRLGPGAVVQHYEVIRRLGAGGMGAVYLARDTRLGRRVAIKLLAEHGGAHAGRFLTEARATAQLHHENIVVIHELGEHRGQPFMVLEYLQGKTFGQLLRDMQEQPPDVVTDPEADFDEPPEPKAVGLPPGRAVELMIPVVRALVFAHEHGIVHRDLKPSNLFLTDAGAVKVLDFGIAKHLGALDAASGAGEAAFAGVSPPDDALTAEGVVSGTKPYMSPEQWRGERADPRTDVWAAGLVLAELVLGRHLLSPISMLTLAYVPQLDVPMPSLRELKPDLGKLASIVDRCLLKRVDDRLGSARELLGELLGIVPSARPVPAADGESNPFAGLSAFQPADAARFFGRTSEIARVSARLSEQPVVAIVGPSGAGKSSFVRAGLIPALERVDAWQSLTLRPGSKPLASLAELLLADTSQTRSGDDFEPVSPLAEDREGVAARLQLEPGLLGARLREAARRKLKRVLIFVDQSEELFTLSPEAERLAFLRCLAGAADDAVSPLRVVLTLRSDFLDRLAEFGRELPALHEGRGLLLLQPMDRDAMREALVRPLEAVEHHFEPPELVDRMLGALSQTRAALPLLSFTAARLWEQRDRARRALTEESYQAMGGLGGALSGHADAVLGAMSRDERTLARAALLRLVTPERTRAVVALRELRELGSGNAMERVLRRLIDARLLSVEGSGEAEATVELVHEALISAWPTLSGWLSESQEDTVFLSRLRDAARAWQGAESSEDLLWRGEVLESARLWRGRFRGELSQGEQRFIEASLRQAERSRQRRRKLTAAVIGALSLVAVTVSGLAIRANRSAAREREAAERAEHAAARAQEEARQARNAARIAAARELEADPTAALAILREVETPAVPPRWAELARWAMGTRVARQVFLHPYAVLSVAWSPDGKRLVIASQDKTARIWNADRRGEPLVLRGHEADVTLAAWSPDGRRIATASKDKTLRVWSADGQGEPLVLRGHGDVVYWVAFSPDGQRLVSVSNDKTVRVWNADGQGEPLLLRGHEEAVHSAAFSPDGQRLVTASNDKTVRVWNADGQGEPLVLRGHEDAVYSAAFSPDGLRIASASNDRTVRVWGADGQGEPLVFRGHEGAVGSVAFSPDGLRIVSASSDRTVRLWFADGRGDALVLRGHENTVWSAAFSPDGLRIATASNDKTARVWSAGDSGQTLVLRGHGRGVPLAAWSPDGRRVVSVSYDKTARVWSAEGRGELVVFRGHGDVVWSAAFSPDGQRIVTASEDKTARVWFADGRGELLVFRGHGEGVTSAAFSPDGQRIVSGSKDKTARVWFADGRGEPLVLQGHAESVTSVAFSPDGQRIVTASEDKTARVWFADGRGEPLVLRGHEESITSAAFSPDGQRIVSASKDKTARVWNADGRGEPLVLRGHGHWVNSAAFSPDGKRIFTASQDGTVRVWNADGMGEPVVLRGAARPYNFAAWSPDGQRIAAPSDDGSVWVWSDLAPLGGPSDPRLWTATNYCLSVERRVRILGVSEAMAEADQAACLRRTDTARGP